MRHRLPAVHALLSRSRLYWRRHLPGRYVRWGNTRRLRPFSDRYGLDRGRPVDRYYIEQFIGRHSADLRDVVMEVRDDRYTRRFGAARETVVLDKDRSNVDATLHTDLDQPGSLPPERFDCIVLTQVLQYTEPLTCLRNLWQSLRPGGVLLLSVPALARIDSAALNDDLWRWTPAGLRKLLVDADMPAAEVEGFGNVLTCQAAVLGLAVEDLSIDELEHRDPNFPLIVCARVRKPPAAALR